MQDKLNAYKALYEVANQHEDHLECGDYERNRTKEAKKKLARLVELQQAIRKQKSITKY